MIKAGAGVSYDIVEVYIDAGRGASPLMSLAELNFGDSRGGVSE